MWSPVYNLVCVIVPPQIRQKMSEGEDCGFSPNLQLG